MSHDHFFPGHYFSAHFIRFGLVLNVDVFLVDFMLLISGGWFSSKSIFFLGMRLFEEIHVFGTFKLFWKVHVNLLSVSQLIKVIATA